jgi:prevent-host-death family protein
MADPHVQCLPDDRQPRTRRRCALSADRVEREHERIVVTRNGRPAIVLISSDDLASLEETSSVLADSEAVRALREADAAVAAGDVVRGVDAVRALRPRPRSDG